MVEQRPQQLNWSFAERKGNLLDLAAESVLRQYLRLSREGTLDIEAWENVANDNPDYKDKILEFRDAVALALQRQTDLPTDDDRAYYLHRANGVDTTDDMRFTHDINALLITDLFYARTPDHYPPWRVLDELNLIYMGVTRMAILEDRTDPRNVNYPYLGTIQPVSIVKKILSGRIRLSPSHKERKRRFIK